MARNKYPEVTEERILEAAQRLFLEKGYDNTTIQDIVDQLGGLTNPKRRFWTRWATGCFSRTTPLKP